MKRKRVVIVTGNQRVAQAIFNDVKAVFNDDVDIDIVYPSQIASLDAVEADAFLCYPLVQHRRPYGQGIQQIQGGAHNPHHIRKRL